MILGELFFLDNIPITTLSQDHSLASFDLVFSLLDDPLDILALAHTEIANDDLGSGVVQFAPLGCLGKTTFTSLMVMHLK